MSLSQRVHAPPDEHPDVPRQEVVIVRWPAQEDLRVRRAADGLPRLLLISRSCPAPVCADELEDWIREPLHRDELETRTATLRHRAQLRARRPRVDASGLVWAGEHRIELPPVQLPVVRLLIAELGHVVSVQCIEDAYRHAGGSTHPKAVKAMIGRVKSRLAEVDLVLTNVRDRGYLLESAVPRASTHRLQKAVRKRGFGVDGRFGSGRWLGHVP